MAQFKTLKSVANSFVASFTSPMNEIFDKYVLCEILEPAVHSGHRVFTLDLLTGEGSPDHLLTGVDVPRSCVEMASVFARMVRTSNSDLTLVRSASMTLTFAEYAEEFSWARTRFLLPYSCRIEITDRRGKLYAAEGTDAFDPWTLNRDLDVFFIVKGEA